MASSTINYPKLTIQIEGKEQIKDLYGVQSFNPKAQEWKDELSVVHDYVSVFTDASMTVPVRKVIIVAPTYNPQTEVAYTTDVRMSYLHPVSGLLTVEKSIEGICIENYPAAFGSTITSIEIKCTAQTKKTIQARIYGWEDEV